MATISRSKPGSLVTHLDVESQVDENAVGLGLDLVGAEEDVGLEVGEGLVDHVGLGGGLGEGGDGAADGALDGQESHVAHLVRARGVEGGVVGGHLRDLDLWFEFVCFVDKLSNGDG